jgi:hypothetical protein
MPRSQLAVDMIEEAAKAGALAPGGPMNGNETASVPSMVPADRAEDEMSAAMNMETWRQGLRIERHRGRCEGECQGASRQEKEM